MLRNPFVGFKRSSFFQILKFSHATSNVSILFFTELCALHIVVIAPAYRPEDPVFEARKGVRFLGLHI
jgi:hypothetical protein